MEVNSSISRRLTELLQGYEHAKVPAPVLGVPRLCSMPMPMEVNSSISRHECKRKGARQGWLGSRHVRPPLVHPYGKGG
jgi:hypothetical protein